MVYNRRSATVSKNEVVFGNQRAKGIAFVAFDAGQRRRSVDIPKNDSCGQCTAFENVLFQAIVFRADTTVLDDDIRARRLTDEARNLIGRAVDNDLRVIDLGIFVLVFLPPVDCGFGECDLVPKPAQVLVDASVISGSAIPQRGAQTGSEDENLHLPNSSQICSN